jgi:hypothetical protein
VQMTMMGVRLHDWLQLDDRWRVRPLIVRLLGVSEQAQCRSTDGKSTRGIAPQVVFVWS